ncbi:hypothetical protein Micbo1qcDRAFT_174226 [Microdochium bolleyi]|uniref:Uncharacterized protein n=1 Tax=Microdochium bolleyi TaxID=196109 RepID=A0A136J7L4_9PEZI|nr:hypothetical protein Micbo1qcDRAFT_174226 [Microdochium bolleyi]
MARAMMVMVTAMARPGLDALLDLQQTPPLPSSSWKKRQESIPESTTSPFTTHCCVVKKRAGHMRQLRFGHKRLARKPSARAKACTRLRPVGPASPLILEVMYLRHVPFHAIMCEGSLRMCEVP